MQSLLTGLTCMVLLLSRGPGQLQKKIFVLLFNFAGSFLNKVSVMLALLLTGKLLLSL